jgi:hypothetical protein
MNLPPEIQREFDYRLQERLGILCGAGTPTKEQQAIAEKEAWEAIKKIWPI